MRVVLTGASSFTGYWFVRALAEAGHEVTAVFTGESEAAYPGLRRRRVADLADVAHRAFGHAFGDEGFCSLLRSSAPDLLCHHGATVGNYRSPDFDPVSALASNTRNVGAVVETLAAGNARGVLLTGSVFERDEGRGAGPDDPLEAFSPYGLSKTLTAHTVAFYARRVGLHFGKFVIANPFGPLEEPNLPRALLRRWFAGETAEVKTPDYVRDQIPVDLLALAYARFAGDLPCGPGESRRVPSWCAGPVGAFAERFAAEMRPRLGLPCRLTRARQTEFPEPRVRTGLETPDPEALGWNEEAAWDRYAAYYRESSDRA